MTEIERRLKKAEQSGKIKTSTQTERSAASSYNETSDTARRLRIAEEQNRRYSAPAANRRAALQRKTESWMDFTTEAEPEAQAAIDRYKATEDAKYYAAMNQRGATIGNDAMQERGFAGYKGAYDLWKSAFDRETDAAADRTRREREMTENPAKAPTVSDIVSRYSGKTKTLADLGNNVRGAIDAYKRQSDAAKAAPTPEEARQQAEESVQYWQNVAREAARFGDVYRQETARKHLADSVENYSRATKGYFDNLKTTDPGTYYALTMTPEEIDHELELLNNGAYLDSKITNSLTNDERIMGEYWHRTPQEQRQYEHNLERARFAGETDDERNAYISSEKEAYRDARNRMLNDASVEGSVGSNQEPYNRREEITQANEARKSVLENARLTQKVIQADREGITNDPQIIASGKQKFEADQQGIWDRWVPEQGWTNQAGGVQMDNLANAAEHGYVLDRMDEMTEEQRTRIYSLYDRDPETALKLAQTYAKALDDKFYQKIFDWAAKDSGWQFGRRAVGNLAGAVMNLASGLDPFGYGGQSAGKVGDALIGGAAQSATRNGWFGIEELGGDRSPISSSVPFVGRGRAGEASQLVSSMEQSALTTLPALVAGRYDAAAASWLETAGLLLQSSSAARSDYRESIEAGLDDTTAKIHAVAAGIAEYTFEKVSFDKLLAQNTSRMTFKKVMKDVLVQAGIEGSEELNTTLANTIMDEIISGDGKSKIDRRIAELVQGGMSMKEAKGVAEKEWLTGIVNDFIGGAASGGIMTGGNYALQGASNLKARAVNAAETRKAQKQAGAAVSRSEGSVEALQAYAKDNGIEIKAVETAEQNAGESAEQGHQDGSKQNSYSNRDYRSISDTNSKVVQSIRSEVRGKTVQEQQTIRDNLVEKYGDGIAPVVNQAISVETAARVRQEYGSVDSIQAARNKAVSEIKDESLRQAVSDGYDSAAYALAANQGGEAGMNTMSRYIQQRKNTGSGAEMTMNATVTAQDGSTKTIAITGMSEDGKRVSLADGSEVAVKDLQADADTTSAIQQLADLDLGADATKVLQAYQQSGVSGTDGYRWLMDYATAYNQGRTRQISLEQAAQRSSLDERTVMDAYTLGQQAANRETQAGLEKLKNLPKRKGASGRTANIDTTEIQGKTMSKSEMEQFELANQYAQALGVDMVWFSSREQGGKFIGKNGAYENGKIYMDIHAGRNFAADLTSGILATMGHELTHFQQQYAPEEYQAIKEFLFEQIVKSSPNGEARLERLIWEKQKRSGNTLSRKAAEDEVVADACQKMLRDSKTVHDFASQQPEAANGVIRWLDKWFKKVRSIFGRGGNYSEEAQLMDSLEQDVKAAFGELWDKALNQAVQVHDEVGNIEKATTEGEIQEESKAQNSDRDTEYLELAKDPEKNAARLQEMVDEAAKRAGYNSPKLYHGTNRFGFTVVDSKKANDRISFFATDSPETAGTYSGTTEARRISDANGSSNGMYQLYANTDGFLELEAGGAESNHIDLGNAQADYNYQMGTKGWRTHVTAKQAASYAKSKGFPGVVIHNVIDTATPGSRQTAAPANVYVFFNPQAQVKSADPVTYDDSGNVIPLSERFNEENQDIRYSEREDQNISQAEKAGVNLNIQSESAAPMDGLLYSERTWRESRFVQDRENAAKALAKALNVSVRKAEQYIDDINSVAKAIADDRARLDYMSSPGRSAFKSNAEYGGSIDFSTLCKKLQLLTGTFNAIQHALANTVLTADDVLRVRQMMQDAGLEVNCGMCYVEGSRARMGEYNKTFLKLYQQYYPDNWQPKMEDVNTTDGLELMRMEHPECYEQYEHFYNNHGTLRSEDKAIFSSQAKPKEYQLRTEYKGEIKEKFQKDSTVEAKNLNGGLRMQSFSDFEIVHLIDCMQVIMDMSEVGLAGQAYTKVPEFAEALGRTGLKINLSLVAKGVDENGKLIFNDVEGMPHERAFGIREKYSENVGTILVVYDDAQLVAAMADDKVDFIIPFHRSQWRKSQYAAMGLPKTTKDYTYQQNEKWLNPKAHTHEYRGKTVPTKCTNYMPNEYWNFDLSGKQNAELYLAKCAEDGKRPKFYKLLQNNGDGSFSLKNDGSTDGYWKLLIDFKMYDNNGVGVPQQPVQPIFDMDNAMQMLDDYSGDPSRFPVAEGIVDEFVSQYKAEHPGRQFSERDISEIQDEYEEALADGNPDWQKQLVAEAAYNAGYRTGAYHGSPQTDITEFNTRSENTKKEKLQLLFGTHFTQDRRYAEIYAKKARNSKGTSRMTTKTGRVYDVWLDLGKSLDLQTAKNYTPGTEMYQLYDDLPDRVKKRVPALKFTEREIEMGLGTGTYVNTGTIEKALQAMTPKEATDFLVGHGYNSVLYLADYSTGMANNRGTRDPSIIMLDPERIKSADPITRSQDGNIIPLTERFNPAKKDIRYSERDYSAPSDEELLDAVQSTELNDTEQKRLLTEYQTLRRQINSMEKRLATLEENRAKLNEKIQGGKEYSEKYVSIKDKEIENLRREIETSREYLQEKMLTPKLADLLNAQRRNAAAKAKQQKEQAFQKYKEGKKAGELRRRITRHSKELYGKLTKPSDKRHIPEQYRLATTALLNAINRESGFDYDPNTLHTTSRGATVGKRVEKGKGTATKRTQAFLALKEALQRIAAEDGFTGELLDFDGDGSGLISQALALGDVPISKMNMEQLGTIWQTVRALEHNITNFNRAFAAGRAETISGIADKFRTDTEGRKPRQRDAKNAFDAKQMKLFAMTKYLENPYTFFDHYGESGHEMFRRLRDAQDLIQVRGDEIAETWLGEMRTALGVTGTDEKVRKAVEDFVEKTDKAVEVFTLQSGQKLTLTHSMMMDVWLLSQREPTGLNHLLGSGVIQPKIDVKGHYTTRDATFRHLTIEDIQEIGSRLTEQEKATARAMQVVQRQLAKWGNEASMTVYGYRKFTEDNYWPVKNAREENKSESGQDNGRQATGTMNKGMARNLKPNAATGTEPVSAFRQLQGSISDMLTYSTWGPTLEDMNRVFNYKYKDESGATVTTVKSLVDQYGGEGSQRYWADLAKHISVGIGSSDNPIAAKIGRGVGAVKGARVAFNARVVIQQPTAYSRAAEVIDHKYLIASLGDLKSWSPGAKSAWNRALKYSPTARRKDSTTYDMGGSIRNDKALGLEKAGAVEKFTDVGTALAGKADALTWGRLWHAAELQISAKTDLEKGSDEYYDAVNKLFTEAVDRTQVMDGILQRPAIMRMNSDFVKGMTAYMGEPLMQVNMLMRQAASWKQVGWKVAKKAMFRTASGLLLSQLINAMVQSVFDATFRRTDEDKDWWERFLAEMSGIDGTEKSTFDKITGVLLGGNLVSETTYLNKIPGINDLLSLIEGYDPGNDRFDLAAAKDLINAVKLLSNDKYTGWHKAKELVSKMTMLFGVGVGNALRDIYGAAHNFVFDNLGPSAKFDFKALWLNPASKKNKSQYFDILAQMAENGDKDAFRQRVKLVRDDGMSNEKFFEYVHEGMTDAFRKRYFNHKLKDDQAVTLLMQYSGKDEKDAWNTVRKWKDQAKHVGADGKLPDGYKWNQYDELKAEVATGNDISELIQTYKANGYSETQINGAIRDSIQEALASGDLDEKEAADALIRYGVTYSKDGKTVVYDKQSAWKKVQEWADKAEHTDEEGELEEGYKYSAYSDLFEAVDANKNADGVIQAMVQNGGYDTDGLRGKIKDHLLERFIAGQITETALKNQLSHYCKISKADDANEIVANAKCKRDFGVYLDDLKEAFKDGDLSQSQAEKALQQYKGLSKTDAQNRVQYWGYDGDLSESAWLKWNNELKRSGLSVENWEKVSKVKSDAKGTDANGDGRADSGTVKAEVVSYIDSMNIPKSQKKAIYLAFGWAASTMPSWR